MNWTTIKSFESAPGSNGMTCATCGVLNRGAPCFHADDCSQRLAMEAEARAAGAPIGWYVPDQ